MTAGGRHQLQEDGHDGSESEIDDEGVDTFDGAQYNADCLQPACWCMTCALVGLCMLTGLLQYACLYLVCTLDCVFIVSDASQVHTLSTVQKRRRPAVG